MKRFLRSRLVLTLVTLVLLVGVTVVTLMPGLRQLRPERAVAASSDRVLILAGTVTGGSSSIEASEAAADGLAVDVVDAATWSAMTAAQFASYRAIILGDPTCSGITPDITAATANSKVWGPTINGNIVILGTDPVYHASQGGETVTRRGVDFAVNQVGKTGAYITLSCYYHGAAPNTPVPLLDGVGAGGFTVTGVGCYNNAHIVAESPALSGLTDADISNWSCSVHEAFQTWASGLIPLAIAKDFDSSFTASDGTQGPPYILAGGDIRSFPLSITPLNDSAAAGGSHTVTAQLLDGVTRNPLAGAQIGFLVTEGPNAGVTGVCNPASCVTGTNGQVSWTYTSNGSTGSDTIEAFYDMNNNGTADVGEPQTTAGMQWTRSDLVDSDGDGLPDDWEKNGVWIQPNGGDSPVFINLPAMGADPKKPDIFLQTDWMQDATHNQQLKAAAIKKVVDAFANSPYVSPTGSVGINLHVDNGPSSILNFKTGATWGTLSKAQSIPWRSSLGTGTLKSYDWSEFQSIKDVRFTPTGRTPIFHYVIVAYHWGSTTSTGISRGIPASDFIISLGSADNGTGTINQQAGTLMHELGHNLGLGHGGGDGVNDKPNYLSVMNYAFQLQGLTIKGVSGNFDYSRSALSSLDETNLNESKGVGGAPAGYGTSHWCPGWFGILPGAYKPVTNASGPIDWNCNGKTTDTAVAFDINNDPNQPSGTKSTLKGFNDWANLNLKGGAIGLAGATPILPMDTEADELTVDLAKQILNLVPIVVKPGSDTTPINPKSIGVIPVAILSTDSFDASTVKPDTVRFGATGTEAKAVHSSLQDVNGDGTLDMVLQFKTQDTGIQCGMTSASLVGNTTGIQPIQGSNTIVTVSC